MSSNLSPKIPKANNIAFPHLHPNNLTWKFLYLCYIYLTQDILVLFSGQWHNGERQKQHNLK